jgi:hypothetical protein
MNIKDRFIAALATKESQPFGNPSVFPVSNKLTEQSGVKGAALPCGLGALILIACLVAPAGAIERLSGKQYDKFLDSYAMISDAYKSRKYKEVDYFGKQTMEEFKVIPLDNRTKVVKNLQPKYLDIFYLMAKANLHLVLNRTMDSLIFCHDAFDFDCMDSKARNLQNTIKSSGILTRKDDSESVYFGGIYQTAVNLTDSLPYYVHSRFLSLTGDDRRAFAAKYSAYVPGMAREADSLDRDNITEKYYAILRQNDPDSIRAFLAKYPTFPENRNLESRLESLLADEYNHVLASKDIADYQEFLDRFPNTGYTKDVQNRLEYQIMKAAIGGQSIYHCRMYMDKYPQGMYLHQVTITFDRLTRGDVEKNPTVPKYVETK